MTAKRCKYQGDLRATPPATAIATSNSSSPTQFYCAPSPLLTSRDRWRTQRPRRQSRRQTRTRRREPRGGVASAGQGLLLSRRRFGGRGWAAGGGSHAARRAGDQAYGSCCFQAGWVRVRQGHNWVYRGVKSERGESTLSPPASYPSSPPSPSRRAGLTV